MTGHDAPEFDGLESTNDPRQEDFPRPSLESPPAASDTGLAGPDPDGGLVERGAADEAITGDEAMMGEAPGGPLRPVAGAGFVSRPIPPFSGHGANGHRRGHGGNGYRFTTRRPPIPAAAAQGATPAGRLPDAQALMKELAGWAAKARRRTECGRLVAAMVPLAFQAVLDWPALLAVLPVLIRGAASVAELMHTEAPWLIALMPAILDRTARRLARLAAQGRPIDAALATDVLADVTGALIDQSRRGAIGRRAARNSGDPRGNGRFGPQDWPAGSLGWSASPNSWDDDEYRDN